MYPTTFAPPSLWTTDRSTAKLAWPLPTGTIIAVIDRWVDAFDALHFLADITQGIAYSGPAGATTIRSSYRSLSWLARIAGHLNGEDELAGSLAEAADAGSTIVVIDSQGCDEQTVAILKRFRARQIEIVGRWSRTSISLAR